MLEPVERMDLTGEVLLDREMFTVWLNFGAPCAGVLLHYAREQLAAEGGVVPDAVWDLCCRTLARPCDDKPLGSRELAGSIVFWLDDGSVPAAMWADLYTMAMIDDLRQRGKTLVTDDDEQAMKSRWVRQLLHQEMDAAREAELSRGGEPTVDFGVSGTVTETEQGSTILETEQAASKLLARTTTEEEAEVSVHWAELLQAESNAPLPGDSGGAPGPVAYAVQDGRSRVRMRTTSDPDAPPRKSRRRDASRDERSGLTQTDSRSTKRPFGQTAEGFTAPSLSTRKPKQQVSHAEKEDDCSRTMAESDHEAVQSKKARLCNSKHDVYKKTRVTDTTQEDQSAMPAGPCSEKDGDAIALDVEDTEDGPHTQVDSEDEEEEDDPEDKAAAEEDLHVLKLLYAGKMAESNRREQQSAMPAGVFNVIEDSSDDEDHFGEQLRRDPFSDGREIAQELHQLQTARQWVNRSGWNAAGEGRAVSRATGEEIDLRLDWHDMRNQLATCNGDQVDTAPTRHDVAQLDQDDHLWWTESCLRLRDSECTKEEDWDIWMGHDLARGHLDMEQKQYFEDHAVWLCARCADVGERNGRKLAHMAQDEKKLIHQIHAEHSGNSKRMKRMPSSAFDGLRQVINLVKDCRVMITRNVAYLRGLGNGMRGRLVGVVYGPAGIGSMPEAIVVDIPDYKGPVFYSSDPTWVPLLPMTSRKKNTDMTRTQFPIVAVFALTVNKAQGLTIKEGVVINLKGSIRFRPASMNGLPFVAFSRSPSFALTAFKNLPCWNEFTKGHQTSMPQGVGQSAEPNLIGPAAPVRRAEYGVAEDYFERQRGAWCGMHALNNYMKGPYISRDACRRAADAVVQYLSHQGLQQAEDRSHHLHIHTGFLSIDVINVLGASVLGIQVEERATSWEHLRAMQSDALVNCNNHHWTVLQRFPDNETWMHTNSILGKQMMHGRMVCKWPGDVETVLDQLTRRYGGFTLHHIHPAEPGVALRFLEREGVDTQSNTDAQGVCTKHQAEMYCCKYCAKHHKRMGTRSVLYEALTRLGRSLRRFLP